MGSPAGGSSLLTSTDMKSIMFLSLFLVSAVFCEAEASPDAYYGYYGHHGLGYGYGHLGYGHHGYGHLGYHGYGLYYGKREAEAAPYHGYYGHHGYGHHGYGHLGYHGYGLHYGKREAEPHHGYHGHHGYGHHGHHGYMDTDTAISTARGKLMPLLTTMDTMAMDMDTDTTDMDIMDIMDTSTDKEFKSLRVETQQQEDSVPRNNLMRNFK